MDFHFELMHHIFFLISTNPFSRQDLWVIALLNDVKILPYYHHRLFYWAVFTFSFISLYHLLELRWWHFWDPGFSGAATAIADLDWFARTLSCKYLQPAAKCFKRQGPSLLTQLGLFNWFWMPNWKQKQIHQIGQFFKLWISIVLEIAIEKPKVTDRQ